MPHGDWLGRVWGGAVIVTFALTVGGAYLGLSQQMTGLRYGMTSLESRMEDVLRLLVIDLIEENDFEEFMEARGVDANTIRVPTKTPKTAPPRGARKRVAHASPHRSAVRCKGWSPACTFCGPGSPEGERDTNGGFVNRGLVRHGHQPGGGALNQQFYRHAPEAGRADR